MIQDIENNDWKEIRKLVEIDVAAYFFFIKNILDIIKTLRIHKYVYTTNYVAAQISLMTYVECGEMF